MSNIPKLRFPEFSGEWEEKKLDSLSLINPKPGDLPEVFSYIDLESVKNGVLLQEKIIKKEEAPSRAQRLLEEKDILFQTVRPYQRNNYFFNSKSPTIASTGYAQFRVNKNNYPSFLYQYLYTNNFVKNVLDRCSGTSFPAISTNDLLEICLYIPTFPEQQKIAEFLSNVDSIITAETKILNTLQKKKKALMQKLFTRQLRFKSADGTDFPEWEEKKMSDICSVNQGLQIAIENRLLEKKANCYFYITNEFIKTGTKYKYYIENPPKNVLCTKDDILMTRTGNTGIVVTDIDGCFHNNFFKINYSRDLVIKGFLIQFFKLSTTQKRILVLAGSSTIPDLNHKDFYSLTIQLPCKAEQQKIADCLSSMDSLIQTQQKVVTTWQQRKKALLQQMFV